MRRSTTPAHKGPTMHMKEIPAAFKTTLTYLDKVNSDGEPKTIKLEDLYEFD